MAIPGYARYLSKVTTQKPMGDRVFRLVAPKPCLLALPQPLKSPRLACHRYAVSLSSKVVDKVARDREAIS